MDEIIPWRYQNPAADFFFHCAEIDRKNEQIRAHNQLEHLCNRIGELYPHWAVLMSLESFQSDLLTYELSDKFKVEHKRANMITWFEFNLDGQLHKTDGPAVYSDTGYQEWWLRGNKHRTDGPAIVSRSYKEWWLDGKRHRSDGPAVESKSKGHLAKGKWWIHGKAYANRAAWLAGKRRA